MPSLNGVFAPAPVGTAQTVGLDVETRQLGYSLRDEERGRGRRREPDPRRPTRSTGAGWSAGGTAVRPEPPGVQTPRSALAHLVSRHWLVLTLRFPLEVAERSRLAAGYRPSHPLLGPFGVGTGQTDCCPAGASRSGVSGGGVTQPPFRQTGSTDDSGVLPSSPNSTPWASNRALRAAPSRTIRSRPVRVRNRLDDARAEHGPRPGGRVSPPEDLLVPVLIPGPSSRRTPFSSRLDR